MLINDLNCSKRAAKCLSTAISSHGKHDDKQGAVLAFICPGASISALLPKQSQVLTATNLSQACFTLRAWYCSGTLRLWKCVPLKKKKNNPQNNGRVSYTAGPVNWWSLASAHRLTLVKGLIYRTPLIYLLLVGIQFFQQYNAAPFGWGMTSALDSVPVSCRCVPEGSWDRKQSWIARANRKAGYSLWGPR